MFTLRNSLLCCRQLSRTWRLPAPLTRCPAVAGSIHTSGRAEDPETTESATSEYSIFAPLPDQEVQPTWAGKKYSDLHIAHVKATHNNTHIQIMESSGVSLVRTSCGTEGFKNCKKGTTIAAQTAAIAAANKVMRKGVGFVRVVVKGLGPGRQAAIKGLTMGGLEVVSITDTTPIPHNGCRPRKARRL
ncbi:small ribosomal subunit protein uS11m isoform X2 [Lampetra fluviatilis]